MFRSVLVVSLLLAGCVSSSDDAGPVVTEPTTLPWGLTGCDTVIVLLPAAAADIEAHLPEGFRAVVHPAIGAPPDPRMEAIMGLEVLRCDEAVGLEGTVPDAVYGSFWTAVQPPEGLEHEHSDLLFYKWDMVESDRLRRDRLADAGAPVHDGGATFSVWQPTPAGTTFDVWLEMNTVGSFRFTGTAAAEEDFSGDFTEFMAVDGGLAHWRTWFRASSGHAGAVVATLQPGSLPAEVMGETTVQGYALVASGVDFYDGWVALPPA